MPTDQYVDVVFDGPPSHESGRFVECEDPSGKSINAGEWIDRGDGTWALRIYVPSNEIWRERYNRMRNELCSQYGSLDDQVDVLDRYPVWDVDAAPRG